MSNRTDIVVETDNAEGRVLLSASRVYDLTEDKTQDTINSEVKNTLNQLETETETVENGLAIIVDGDTCSMAVPAGGYAYIKNNAHGLADGLYTNTSSSAFPVSGGTADGTVFTAVLGGGLNSINDNLKIETINVNVNRAAMNGYGISVFKIGSVVYVRGYVNPIPYGDDLLLFSGFPQVSSKYNDVIAPCTCIANDSYTASWCILYTGSSDLKFSCPVSTRNYYFCFSYVTA